jgi:hypothetical protein
VFTLHGQNRTVALGRFARQPVDLNDCLLLHGGINAHDHLELNHYPRTSFRERYDNAHDWGDDVNARLNDPPYRELRQLPLWDRCFIGGLKNLLGGVTTVVQHGAHHRPLQQRGFPVRVMPRYGWAHSLHFETPAHIQQSFRRTPKGALWFIHLAEGTDARAASEFAQLQALGVAASHTVLVHGVGLSPSDFAAVAALRGVITCPTTNRYLLGTAPDIRGWESAGIRVGIGSDSRLTADGDWLDELPDRTPQTIERLTRANATLLGIPLDRLPDVIALRGAVQGRADLALVICRGTPMIGDPDVMQRFGMRGWVHATLDGRPKWIHPRLAQQVRRCRVAEVGLHLYSP